MMTRLASSAPLVFVFAVWWSLPAAAYDPDPLPVVIEPAIGELDQRLPEFKVDAKLKGELHFAGSMSISSLVERWTAGFQAKCAGVRVEYDAVGSRNAIPGLLDGSAPMIVTSRALLPGEIEEFRTAHGYAPIEVGAAIEVFAMFVHRDNPVRGLTLAEFDALWSSTRARGGAEVSRWSNLGAKGDWDKPATLYVRERDSFGPVMTAALDKGRIRNDANFVEDGEDACASLANDKFGAAFGKLGSRREFARAVAVSDGIGRPAPPTYTGLREGNYPLVRRIYLYVHKKPNRPLDPAAREFLRYVLSRNGQQDVINEERCPLSREMAADLLARLGIK